MIKFIRAYQSKELPSRLLKIQQMLKTVGAVQEVTFTRNAPNSVYFVKNLGDINDDLKPAKYSCFTLKEGCDKIYECLIKNEPKYATIDFAWIDKTVGQFPKKHQENIQKILYEFFALDPIYNKNGGLVEYDRQSGIVTIAYDGGPVYDYLGFESQYRSDDLRNYIESLFEFDDQNSWSLVFELD